MVATIVAPFRALDRTVLGSRMTEPGKTLGPILWQQPPIRSRPAVPTRRWRGSADRAVFACVIAGSPAGTERPGRLPRRILQKPDCTP
jgi:hypothetical protein